MVYPAVILDGSRKTDGARTTGGDTCRDGVRPVLTIDANTSAGLRCGSRIRSASGRAGFATASSRCLPGSAVAAEATARSEQKRIDRRVDARVIPGV